MNLIKKYIKTIGLFLLFIVLFATILSVFNQFHIMYSKGSDIMIMITMVLTFIIIGFYYGKKAPSKGYLEGLKIGFTLILLLIVINILFYRSGFSLEKLIYYIVLILSSILGSMVGINKKN